MKGKPRSGTALCVGVIAALCSCASGNAGGALYVHPYSDLSAYEQIAVLPLDNLAIDRAAGDRVRDILVVELSAQGLYDVVDTGEVNRVLRIEGFTDTSGLGPEQIKQIGDALEVQALFLGSVIEYRERRSGTITAPDVSLSLRLIDVETGIVTWSVSDARTGVSMSTRLFGVGEQSMSEATRDLIRRMIDTLTY